MIVAQINIINGIPEISLIILIPPLNPTDTATDDNQDDIEC